MSNGHTPTPPNPFNFLSLTLDWKNEPPGPFAFGVYVIRKCVRQTGIPVATIYVGKGNIQDRLSVHIISRRITAHRDEDYTLDYLWAMVDRQHVDGVERYLADQLKPLEGERHPDVPHIRVNLP